MKYSHDRFIGVYEEAFPTKWCQALINFYESSPPNFKHNRQILIEKTQTPINQFEIVEDEAIGGGNVDQNLKDFFYKTLNEKILPLYVKKYPFTSELFEEFVTDDFKLQKTLPSEGFHTWHSEQGPTYDSTERFGVYTIFLNDVKEGGETEFLYQSKRIKPKQGSICIFPASYTHVHRGNPPLSGSKYIVTGWFKWDKETYKTNNNE